MKRPGVATEPSIWRATRFVTMMVIALVVSLVGCGDEGQEQPGPSNGPQRSARISYDDGVTRLSELLQRVDSSERFVTERENVDLGKRAGLASTLPDIDQFPVAVEPQVGPNDVVVEVFASTEKSGSGSDGWMVEVVNDFNGSARALASGKNAKVRLRKIASGTGYQYIASRKYLPDAYTPSNALWIKMAQAQGVNLSPVSERLVGNVAGVVMKSSVAEKLRSGTGNVDMTALVDAVVRGDVAMGYTNPFASSTGLNFLVSVLSHFSKGNEDQMLSPAVISAFEGFQRGVPFVALTTLQMRDSVAESGSLDAFVMEYQTFTNTELLQTGYEFIPFGVRHDNPLYAVGDLGVDKREVLDALAKHAAGFAELATRYGFNSAPDHRDAFAPPPGDLLVQAQQTWKQKKNAGRPVAAVFLSDISGSMAGSKIRGVREALRKGIEFVSPENSIGLVFFSDIVTVALPIKKFDLNHRATFLAAVRRMDTGGGTAMYDGIAVALSLLVEEQRKNPDVKPMLLTLSDGVNKDGLAFEEVVDVVRGLRIPVYTIGFEANIPELKRVSSLVEAATIDAKEGDIAYKIGTLLNAQL